MPIALAAAALLAAAPPPAATVRVPVANVWEAPNAGHLPLDPHVWPTAAVTVSERLALVGRMPTQVLYGERVRVLARRGGWTKIAVPDQLCWLAAAWWTRRFVPTWLLGVTGGVAARMVVLTHYHRSELSFLAVALAFVGAAAFAVWWLWPSLHRHAFVTLARERTLRT